MKAKLLTVLTILSVVSGSPFCGRLLGTDNHSRHAKYDYTNHGDDWTVCHGVRQSPIRIEGSMLNAVKNSPVQVTVKEAKGKMALTMERSRDAIAIEGAELEKYELHFEDKVYNLAGFHFHADAEHVLINFSEDGEVKRGEAEVHFVFVNADGYPAAVVGVVLFVDDDDLDGNDFLKTLEWPEADGKPHAFAANFTNGVLGPLTDKGEYGYVYYTGSLTTPNCDEGISWFVTASHMNREQSTLLDVLKEGSGGGNYRNPQNQACRDVQTANLHLK